MLYIFFYYTILLPIKQLANTKFYVNIFHGIASDFLSFLPTKLVRKQLHFILISYMIYRKIPRR